MSPTSIILQIGLQCSAGVVTVDPVIHKIVAVVPRQGQQLSHHCLQHPAMLRIDLVSSQQGGGAWTSKEQAEGDLSSSQIKSVDSYT